MQALAIYAGPRAYAHLACHGLQPRDVQSMPAAAGGPKGLILGPLDRFLFGTWLPQSIQRIDLIGASIGAWRMATACLNHPVSALLQLEHDYIHQHYALRPGEKRPPPERVSSLFGQNLRAFYAGRVTEVLTHPRYRLHVLASRGRGLLAREQSGVRSALGFAAAFGCNVVSRRALGWFLQRVVFSSFDSSGSSLPKLPFDASDYPTQQVALTEENFNDAMQASCSIPFVLQAVHDIAGAPPGAYWDGGVTDYHLHLNYSGLVLYPHFQQNVVPGWLDKHLSWRHAPSPFLQNMVVLAPNPAWVKTLPLGKLPDRHDFIHYGADLKARVKAWSQAVAAAQQLADEFALWLENPDMARVQPI
jgi:hypothetical protein